MRLNVCFNEMALFGSFAALIKGCSSYGRNGSQPTREDDSPARLKVFAVERPGLPEDFVSFPALCGIAIVATRIYSEFADCLGSATVAGTGETLCLRFAFS